MPQQPTSALWHNVKSSITLRNRKKKFHKGPALIPTQRYHSGKRLKSESECCDLEVQALCGLPTPTDHSKQRNFWVETGRDFSQQTKYSGTIKKTDALQINEVFTKQRVTSVCVVTGRIERQQNTELL